MTNSHSAGPGTLYDALASYTTCSISLFPQLSMSLPFGPHNPKRITARECNEVGDDVVTGTTAKLILLRQSIRANGVDDWRTLGDWSQATHVWDPTSRYHFLVYSSLK